jgi:hypothetical protein
MSMKLVCELLINGEMQTKVITTVSGLDANASFVKSKPGVGKPFYMFNTLPGTVVGADYDGAPIVSEDVAANKRAIEQMLADPPLDKITFA